jgi:transcriptional regulator EpsA
MPNGSGARPPVNGEPIALDLHARAAPLGAVEREHFFEIVESAAEVRRTAQLFLWTQGALQRLLPHEILVFGAAAGNGSAVSLQRLSSTRYFADAHFAEVCRPGQGLIVRVMSAWHRLGTPLLVSRALRSWEAQEDWLALAEAQELKNFAAHGMRSPAGRVATFFCFARVGCEFDARLAYRLALLMPCLHEVLTRVCLEERRISARLLRGEAAVTEREAEILRWIRDGKTNDHIARILNVSRYTVKNHIQKILRKMAAENRSHAVARAISLGILGAAERE